jgi:hypothetical protein
VDTQIWDTLVESMKNAYTAGLSEGAVPRPVIMPLVRGELVGLIRVRPTSAGRDAQTGIMSKVLTSLPVGERVGIAFSGGLDTSVAVAWMRDKGAVPCTYTADIGQYDEPDIASVPGRAQAYGAEIARLVDCRARWSRRAWPRSPAARSTSAPAGRLLQHHPARPRRHRHAAGAGDARGRRADLGRRLDLQGQRHRAVLPLRPARQPALRIYKPWLDADFVTELGGRKEMSEWLLAHGPALPGQHGEGVLHRRQHLGRHPRGQDAGAPRHRHGDRRADHGRAVLGPEVEIPPRT